MELSDWIEQTNRILFEAEQELPAECVQQLRISQQFLMLNHLQSGFLHLEARTPLEHAMNANPFRKIDFGL